MRRFYVIVCGLAALHFCVPSIAQDSAPQAPKASVTTDKFDDWLLRCRKAEGQESRTCLMRQRLVVTNTDHVALDLSIGFARGPEESVILVSEFKFPLELGLYLPGGVDLRIDESESIHLDLERCFPGGCLAVLVMDEANLARFKKGANARITVKRTREESIDMNVSLRGFTAAHNALSQSVGIGSGNS